MIFEFNLRVLSAVISIPAIMWTVGAAFGQDSIAPKRFEERYVSNVPTSGRVVVGLMVASQNSDSSHTWASMLVASQSEQATTGSLCLVVSSIDGRYSARIEYDWPAQAASSAEFAFPTQHHQDLAQYNIGELVVLGSIRDNCTSSATSILAPMLWKGEAFSRTAILFVNAGLYRTSLDLVEVRKVEGEEYEEETIVATYECRKISSARPTLAYDTTCPLPNLAELEGRFLDVNRTRLSTRLTTRLSVAP